MKKLFALLLAVMMVVSMATVVSAENTTTLTTEVPAATYTLNIPIQYEIPFGVPVTNIGTVTVTDGTGFAAGKNLKVTATWEDFACDNVSTTIPFAIGIENSDTSTDVVTSGFSLIFEGGYGTGTSKDARSKDGKNLVDGLTVRVENEDWAKALAGVYTAIITYSAEVVVE